MNGVLVEDPDLKAALAAAYSRGDTPRFVQVISGTSDELWVIGESALVVPGIPANAPAGLEFGLRARRDALFSGSCEECNSVLSHERISIGDSEMPMLAAVLKHRASCPASDESLAPQLRSFRESQASIPKMELIEAASRNTRERVQRELGVSGSTPGVSKHFERWAKGLLDSLTLDKQVPRCDHIKREPYQTWNLQLGQNRWMCDNCWAYQLESLRSGVPIVDPVEDNTCDRCRRESDKLEWVVLRIGTWVMSGGLCTACIKWSSQQLPAQRRRSGSKRKRK